MSEAIRHYVNEFHSRRDVSPYDADFLFQEIISTDAEDLLVDLLSAWSLKGVTEDELFRFASILRSRMQTVDPRGLDCVDIVGTGGSTTKTFNVSTAAAFVTAGAGIPVAKHGNKAATSSSGSADVLTHLGINVDIEPSAAEEQLHEHGICFMFAPRHHALSATLAAARKRVRRATIFNCIGPLSNPASAQHQLIGVWDARLLSPMSRVLYRLGTKRSWVVNHNGTLDEIGIDGSTEVASVGDSIERLSMNGTDLVPDAGSSVPSVDSPKESAKLIEAILTGEMSGTAVEQIVLLNTAAAISLVTADALEASFAASVESVRTGAAFNKLKALRKKK